MDTLPNVSGAAVDARGNGQMIAELAAQEWPGYVHQVMITTHFYAETFPKLKERMEDGTTTIPDDPFIRDDFQMVGLKAGVPCVLERSGGLRERRHGDGAITKLMALYSRVHDKEQGYQPMTYDAVTTPNRYRPRERRLTQSPKRPIREQAYSVQYTNRHPWGDFSLLHRLTPKHLATILSDVRRGECPVASLELAQDRELKDPHYRSVLSTRKDAITGLEIKGIPASDASHDTALAQALERDIVHNPKTPLRSLFRDMLDALAKGFSVTEIIWNTTHIPWKPAAYKFRNPRWFQYDKETGTTLMLRAPYGIALEPLKPLHFVIHEPHLISGTQITSGLALPALYYWMLKSYDVASWAAFIDRYGYPIRIGKYGKKATERDIATLKRAVANIAADFGAVIPESALLEIIESKHARETATVHKNMADWVDKQLSKLILGQTMTTDEGSSKAQRETHEKVRDDIADSDSMQVVDTLHAQLTVPYIHLNFGEHGAYPKIDLFKPDEKNIEQIILAIEKIGPQGLTVKADEIRSILGLSKPDKGDEVIGGLPDPVLSDTADGPPKPHLNAVQTETPEELERLLEASTDSYIPITDDIAEVLETAASRATDFETFQEALLKLVKDWSPDTIAQCIALATFKARALGDAQFDQE